MADALTLAEEVVVARLADAWNAFLALPVEHPDQVAEFRHGIHAVQCQILARPAARMINSRGDRD